MEPEASPVDSLTVPETTLLQHLQRGAPDAEIAVRLGLPIGEEKARVHALFGRLGIESRNGLATWDGVVRAIVESPEEPSAPPGATVEALFEPTPRNHARLLPLAICGLVVIAAGALVATAREGGSPTLAPSAALRTIDQLGAPAAYVDGVPLPRLRIGATTPLPTDLALVQWETRSGVVRRTYRSQEGTIHLEDLFVPPSGGTVTQVAATPDGREMVVAVSSPRTSGLSPIVTVFRSNDGGATWGEPWVDRRRSDRHRPWAGQRCHRSRFRRWLSPGRTAPRQNHDPRFRPVAGRGCDLESCGDRYPTTIESGAHPVLVLGSLCRWRPLRCTRSRTWSRGRRRDRRDR